METSIYVNTPMERKHAKALPKLGIDDDEYMNFQGQNHYETLGKRSDENQVYSSYVTSDTNPVHDKRTPHVDKEKNNRTIKKPRCFRKHLLVSTAVVAVICALAVGAIAGFYIAKNNCEQCKCVSNGLTSINGTQISCTSTLVLYATSSSIVTTHIPIENTIRTSRPITTTTVAEVSNTERMTASIPTRPIVTTTTNAMSTETSTEIMTSSISPRTIIPTTTTGISIEIMTSSISPRTIIPTTTTAIPIEIMTSSITTGPIIATTTTSILTEIMTSSISTFK